MNEREGEAQRLRQIIEAQARENANNNNDGNVLGDEASVSHCQFPRGRGQQRHVNPIDFGIDNDDEGDLDRVEATGAIIHPPLAQGSKLTSQVP